MGSDSNIPNGENLDQVQELTWALLDEQISEDEFEQLSRVLLRDDKSREAYLGCIQLHTDLITHFAGPEARTPKRPGTTPILGLDMPLGFQSPASEESAS
jgi:hypothetical protein